MAGQVRDLADQLKNGGQGEAKLTRVVLENFLAADSSNRDAQPLNERINVLEKTLLEIAHETDNDAKLEALQDADCSLEAILDLVEAQ